jgi:arylsulfatase
VGAVYGVIDAVVQFAATYKEFPPRSIPPSFSAWTIMEETINDIRDAKKRAADAQKAK